MKEVFADITFLRWESIAGSTIRKSNDGPQTSGWWTFEARRQWVGAGLVAVLALSFDLLFFAVDELPATVPVAVALALVQLSCRRPTS